MSNRDPEAWSNDDRAVRPRERTETTGRPLTDIVYYGFGQLFLLCLPMMWLVSVTPFSNGVVRIGFAVSILTIPVLVGFFRRGRLTVGRAWPRFTNADLGVGGGYGDFLTRSVYFSSVIALCAYGGGAAELITGSVLANVIVAAAVAVFGTGVLPYLTRTSTPTLAGRATTYAVALGAVYFGAAPFMWRFVPEIGVVFLCYVGLALLDVRPLAGTIREQVGGAGRS